MKATERTLPQDGPVFVCFTADVIGSRQVADRGQLQAQLEAAAAALNERFAPALVVPFAFTAGDEMQALCQDLASALDVEFRLRLALHPRRLRCGLGVGPVATPLRLRTAEMDGPCFLLAREAVAESPPGLEETTVLKSGRPGWDDPVNAALLLLTALSGGWSDKQVEAVETYSRCGTQTAAARQLGISQPAFRKRLQGAHAGPYLEARRLLLGFSRRLWEEVGT